MSPMLTLESVNIGQPRTAGRPDADDPFEGAFTSAIWKEPVRGTVWLDANGLSGDRVADSRHHGGPYRAVLMYSADHYPRWRSEWNNPDLGPGGFGENLTVRGVIESIVCLGDIFEIGEALLSVTSPRTPCHKLARRHRVRDLVPVVRANHRHGWYLKLLRPGWIEAGQPVRVRERPYPQWTIDRTAEVGWYRHDRLEDAALLAECPALIPEWREKLREAVSVSSEPGAENGEP